MNQQIQNWWDALPRTEKNRLGKKLYGTIYFSGFTPKEIEHIYNMEHQEKSYSIEEAKQWFKNLSVDGCRLLRNQVFGSPNNFIWSDENILKAYLFKHPEPSQITPANEPVAENEQIQRLQSEKAELASALEKMVKTAEKYTENQDRGRALENAILILNKHK